MSVIIAPPITPNNFWRFGKRNSQERLHLLVLSLLGKITPSVTPGNSQGIDRHNQPLTPEISTSDFQSEVGEVFGEIGGELAAKFGRRYSSLFCWGKSSEAFSTKTPPQISPSNFTTRFWVVAGPIEKLLGD